MQIQQGCIQLINMGKKDIQNVIKISQITQKTEYWNDL